MKKNSFSIDKIWSHIEEVVICHQYLKGFIELFQRKAIFWKIYKIELVTITIQVSLFTNIFTVQLQPHQVRHKTELNKMIRLITKQQMGKKRCEKRMLFFAMPLRHCFKKRIAICMFLENTFVTLLKYE